MQKIMRNSGFCNTQSILLPKSVIRKKWIVNSETFCM